MRHPRKHLWRFFGFTALYLSVVAGLNVVVDPFGVHRVVDIPALERHRFKKATRTGRAEAARKSEADVFLVGDSRTLWSISPDLPPLQEIGKVESLGVAGCTVYEAMRMIELTQEKRAPRVVLWGFDPEMLSALPERHMPAESRLTWLNPDLNRIGYAQATLTGPATLLESLKVLARIGKPASTPSVTSEESDGAFTGSDRREPPRVTASDASPGKSGRSTPSPTNAGAASRTSLSAGFDERYLSAVSNWAKFDDFYRRREGFVETALEELGPKFELWQSNGTRLILVIPPMAAMTHAAIFHAPERWRRIEHATRLLVECTNDLNERNPHRPPIEIWDFRGFSPMQREGTSVHPSHNLSPWFKDPVHATRRMGGLVVDRIFRRANDTDSFGVRISAGNVLGHLANLRKNLESFEAETPGAAAFLAEVERKIPKEANGYSKRISPDRIAQEPSPRAMR